MYLSQDPFLDLKLYGTDVVLLCFALDSRQSFCDLTQKWIPEIKRSCEKACIILVGTKSDLYEPGHLEHVSEKEIEKFVASQKFAGYILCSAKTGDGVEQIFPSAIQASKYFGKNLTCGIF